MLVAVHDAPQTFTVRPWPDSVLDQIGHDPRSPYLERFWLGALGPSSVVFLRRVATELEANPAGFDLPLEETAKTLGLGMKGGRNSPFLRTINRCAQFHLLHLDEADRTLLARRKLPPLTRGQVLRLPPPLQAQHLEWQEDPAQHDQRMQVRARRLALSLLELGENVEATERQLQRWRFHPLAAREATAWAWRRHSDAKAAAEAWTPDDAA
ncbi:MAG TPA: hypothetical protein VGZ52_08315 [Acidimicrobiales bacterium]|jgi:hypothetical protein|nr:hypothetical protein [Acidimicrobiales bacterium]